MNVFTTFLLLISMVFAPVIEDKNTATFVVDLSQSTVTWSANKVTGGHFGKVPLSKGSLDYENGKLTGGNFEMDMTSLTVEDLTNEASNKKLTAHLKSDDFFGVATHGKSNFVITDATSSNGTDYVINGNLTIKNITQPISFPATVSTEGNKVIAKAKITFDRTKFDIKFRSGNYFENLADNLIYDDVNLDVNLVSMIP